LFHHYISGTGGKVGSDADRQAKTRILTLLRLQGKKSGVLFDGPIMTIEYVSSADVFQVEIHTPDLQLGKEEAVNWFENSGFSMDAICNYPVEFYPSREHCGRAQCAGYPALGG
jgi:hypothetical protein